MNSGSWGKRGLDCHEVHGRYGCHHRLSIEARAILRGLETLERIICKGYRCYAASSAMTVTDVYYIIMRMVGSREQARRRIELLATVFRTASVGEDDIFGALGSDMDDSEDAVLPHCAERYGSSIVTRNAKDFMHSPVSAILPKRFRCCCRALLMIRTRYYRTFSNGHVNDLPAKPSRFSCGISYKQIFNPDPAFQDL